MIAKYKLYNEYNEQIDISFRAGFFLGYFGTFEYAEFENRKKNY